MRCWEYAVADFTKLEGAVPELDRLGAEGLTVFLTPDDLKREVGADTVEMVTADDSLAAIRLVAAGFQVRPGEGRLVVFADDGSPAYPA